MRKLSAVETSRQRTDDDEAREGTQRQKSNDLHRPTELKFLRVLLDINLYYVYT